MLVFRGIWVSVSLRSIIHSYFEDDYYDIVIDRIFPSPYGVSFILIFVTEDELEWLQVFPSPYGVSFIFIWLDLWIKKGVTRLFPSPYRVSFILILKTVNFWSSLKNFRLLTEYHSFLWTMGTKKEYIWTKKFPSPYRVSFILMSLKIVYKKQKVYYLVFVSLRSIIHSYKEVLKC